MQLPLAIAAIGLIGHSCLGTEPDPCGLSESGEMTARADVSGDGLVDFDDVQRVFADWGSTSDWTAPVTTRTATFRTGGTCAPITCQRISESAAVSEDTQFDWSAWIDGMYQATVATRFVSTVGSSAMFASGDGIALGFNGPCCDDAFASVRIDRVIQFEVLTPFEVSYSAWFCGDADPWPGQGTCEDIPPDEYLRFEGPDGFAIVGPGSFDGELGSGTYTLTVSWEGFRSCDNATLVVGGFSMLMDGFRHRSDVDSDGTVGFGDLLAVLSAWE